MFWLDRTRDRSSVAALDYSGSVKAEVALTLLQQLFGQRVFGWLRLVPFVCLCVPAVLIDITDVPLPFSTLHGGVSGLVVRAAGTLDAARPALTPWRGP